MVPDTLLGVMLLQKFAYELYRYSFDFDITTSMP